jgi:hypothetical protein
MKKTLEVFLSKKPILALAFMLGFTGWNAVNLRAEGSIAYRGELKVRFFATSTLHDFEGEIPTIKLEASRLVMDAPSPGDRWEAISKVGVKTLTTHHEKRDVKMLEMFKEDRFPVFQLQVNDAIQPSSDDTPASLPVMVTILGKSVKVEGHIKDWSDTEGKVSFRLETELSLGAFGLERPGTAFGLIRVGDKVRVEADVHVVRKEESLD